MTGIPRGPLDGNANTATGSEFSLFTLPSFGQPHLLPQSPLINLSLASSPSLVFDSSQRLSLTALLDSAKAAEPAVPVQDRSGPNMPSFPLVFSRPPPCPPASRLCCSRRPAAAPISSPLPRRLTRPRRLRRPITSRLSLLPLPLSPRRRRAPSLSLRSSRRRRLTKSRQLSCAFFLLAFPFLLHTLTYPSSAAPPRPTSRRYTAASPPLLPQRCRSLRFDPTSLLSAPRLNRF